MTLVCLPHRAARINSEMSQRSNVEIRSVALLTVSSSCLRADRSDHRRGHIGSPALDDTVNVITIAIQFRHIVTVVTSPSCALFGLTCLSSTMKPPGAAAPAPAGGIL